MALDPGTGSASGAPSSGPFGAGSGSSLSTPFAANAPGWGAPTFSIPDYNALLAQYMAPFRQIYEAQMAALQGNINRQIQYARQAEGLAEDQVGIARDRLNQSHDITVRNILNTLTARGLGQSGEMPYQKGNEQRSYDNSNQSLDNQLESLKNQLANTIAGLQYQLQAAQYSGLMGLQQQQLGLLPFLQSTYQPTVTPRNPGDAQALALPTLGNQTPPPVSPPGPVLPINSPYGVQRAV